MLATFQTILAIVDSCETIAGSFAAEGKIENANDYLMDAQIVKMSHELMGSTADKIGNSEFNEAEFIAAIINKVTMQNGDTEFSELANHAVKCCRTSQFSVSLFGAFDFDAAPRPEKARKERRQSKKLMGPPTKVVNVTQLEKRGKGAEKINIVRKRIVDVCRDLQTDSLPYYQLICHPHNFMKSIDIAFQISFLVREGTLGLKKENGEPYVYLYNSEQTQQSTQSTQHPSDTVQCVMSLDTKTWQENIVKYAIKEPLLKCEFGDEGEEAGSCNEEMDVESD